MKEPGILAIVLLLLLSNINYGLASPFIPVLIAERGIASIWTGLLFAVYSISYVMVSFITGNYVDRIGHAKVIGVGTLLMSVSVGACSTVIFMESNALIIGVAVFLRVCQGKYLGCLTDNCALRWGFWNDQHDRVLLRGAELSGRC